SGFGTFPPGAWSLDPSSRGDQPFHFVPRGKSAARTERSTVQGGDRVGIGQRVLDRPLLRGKTASRKPCPKRIACSGRVDAPDAKRRRPDFAAAAPGEAALLTERRTDQRRRKLALHRFQRAPNRFVARQLGRKLRGGNDGVDLLKEPMDAWARVF